jgi:hypothetical protein
MRPKEFDMSKRPLASVRTLAFVVAAALAGGTSPASALTVDVSVEATQFVGLLSYYQTGELPPQEVVNATFTIDTDGPRDVPDVVTTASNGDGPTYEVLNVYTTPTAADIEIAGYAYPLADLAAYLGFVDGTLAQILVSGRYQYEGTGGPAAHVMTAGTNDFILNVNLESDAGYEGNPHFYYATAETVSGFRAFDLEVSVSLDGGPPREFVVEPADILETFIPCYTATPAEDGAELEGGAEPGGLLCLPPDEEEARSAGSANRLREARTASGGAARAALSEPLTLTTELGTVTVATGKSNRMLLPAATGDSAEIEQPADGASYRCAKVRRAKGAEPFERPGDVLVAGTNGGAPSIYSVRNPRPLSVASDGTDPLLCYAARAKGRTSRSELWVAHSLGVERLKVARLAEVCLPASAEE